MLDRFGDQVEERGPDPDPGADRDDHPDVADGAQREPAAERGPSEGAERDGQRASGIRWIVQRGSPGNGRTARAGGRRCGSRSGVRCRERRPAGRRRRRRCCAAARADDVVVMGGFAGDVGVFAGRQVEALDRPQLGQDVERPEDRRAADPQPAGAGVRDQVGRGEVAIAAGDQVHDGPSRSRQRDSRRVPSASSRVAVTVVHGPDDTQSQYADVQPASPRPTGTPGRRDLRPALEPPSTAPHSSHATRPKPGHGGTTMTIEVGTQKVGRVGRRGAKRSATALAIGETDANIFPCPSLCSTARCRCVAVSRLRHAADRRRQGVAGRARSSGIGVFSGMIVGGALHGLVSP